MSRAGRTSSRERNTGDHHACEECSRNCQLMHVTQANLSSCVTRFFKILVGQDWPEALLLPPSVEKTVAGKVGRKIELENALGQKWTVTLSSYGGRYAFHKGWVDFVEDNDLNGGDLLVFNHVKGIKGPEFVVHVFGKTGREKNCNGVLQYRRQGNASAQVKPRVRVSMDATEGSIQRASDAPGLKSKPCSPEPTSKPSAPGPISAASAPGPNSKPSAPGPKSTPSSVPQSICKPPYAFSAQDHGGDDEMLDSSYAMSNHEVHKLQAYGNKKVIDGETGPSKPHTGIRLQAEASEGFIETENLKSNTKVTDVSMRENDHSGMRARIEGRELTDAINEKDHADMRSPGEANEDCIGTKNMKSNTKVGKPQNGHRSVRSRIDDRMNANKVKSNLPTKVTDVSMAEKDHTSLRSLPESNKDLKSNNITSEFKVGRDDSTRKHEKENSDDPFKHSCEEPGQKGNDQNSLGASKGAVFLNSGQKSIGHLKKNVEKEQKERSEPGHIDAKRKRDFEPALEESIDFKLVKIEPCDDISAEQDIVSCLAVTHGQCLELPDKLPAPKFLKRGAKVVYLLDQKRKLWPALYEERSGFLPVLICEWDTFNPWNGVQAGDGYAFALEDASQFIYRIDVFRPM